MQTLTMTPILAVSSNFLNLEQPFSIDQLWVAAEHQASLHCRFCRSHGFSPAYAVSIIDEETAVASWREAAEVLTCAFVKLYRQADSCIAGGF